MCGHTQLQGAAIKLEYLSPKAINVLFGLELDISQNELQTIYESR